MAYYTKKEIEQNIEATKTIPLSVQRDQFQARFNAAKRARPIDNLIGHLISIPIFIIFLYVIIKALKFSWAVMYNVVSSI
jgi:hypothetical protein